MVIDDRAAPAGSGGLGGSGPAGPGLGQEQGEKAGRQASGAAALEGAAHHDAGVILHPERKSVAHAPGGP